jgi:hypothetical protein
MLPDVSKDIDLLVSNLP